MRLATALALAGCGSPQAAIEYDGHFHVEYAHDDSTHTTGGVIELHRPEDVAVAMVGDPRASASFTADGYIHFTTYDPAYRLLVTADGVSTEYQLHASHLEIATRQAGRRHPAPVTSDATRIELAPPAAVALAPDSRVVIASTGLWARADLGPAAELGALALRWRDARPVDAEFGLLTADDRVFAYALEPCIGCATPYRALTRAIGASFAQVDGAAATVTEPVVAPPAFPVAVHAAVADELARAAPAFGDLPATAAWGIDSIAVPELGPLGRLPLAASIGVQPPNTDATVPVANIFAGTTAVGWLETRFTRTAGALELVHGTLTIAQVADGAVSVTGAIGIPGTPAVGGLAGDDDPVVAWDTAVPGPIDDHVVALVDADTGITLRTIVVDGQRALLDRTLLEPGHRYLVRVDARLGYPAWERGYYLAVAYPFAIATTWSEPFELP